MRCIRGLWVLLSVLLVSPATAKCSVYEPISGKIGFRLEIVAEAPDGSGRVLVYRPFEQTPDAYRLVFQQETSTGKRYALLGPAGVLWLEISSDGRVVLQANREMPSQWRPRNC
jgi:hypothetical protein